MIICEGVSQAFITEKEVFEWYTKEGAQGTKVASQVYLFRKSGDS